MNTFKYIVLRREIKLNEFRVPLVPNDCNKLINRTMTVYIERCNKRCFSDILYSDQGCIMIDSYLDLPHNKNEILVVGLKELGDDPMIYSYNHLYFSHTFKNQLNSMKILKMFKENGGSIYDLEYFTDKYNNRLFAFGYHAGIVGCYLGLLQYYYKKQGLSISNIKPFRSFELLVEHIQKEKLYIYIQPTIAIIGNGRCASGCIALLDLLELPYTILTRNDIINSNKLSSYNIVINCILINRCIKFIIPETLHQLTNTMVIVDISCDYNNIYNPIAIYDTPSSLIDPVIRINDKLDLIAIDNLPSLLPFESCQAFSSKLVEIINTDNSLWVKTHRLFLNKIM